MHELLVLSGGLLLGGLRLRLEAREVGEGDLQDRPAFRRFRAVSQRNAASIAFCVDNLSTFSVVVMSVSLGVNEVRSVHEISALICPIRSELPLKTPHNNILTIGPGNLIPRLQVNPFSCLDLSKFPRCVARYLARQIEF